GCFDESANRVTQVLQEGRHESVSFGTRWSRMERESFDGGGGEDIEDRADGEFEAGRFAPPILERSEHVRGEDPAKSGRVKVQESGEEAAHISRPPGGFGGRGRTRRRRRGARLRP